MLGFKYSKSFFDPQSAFLYLHGIFILFHLFYNFCKHSLRFDENIRNDLGRVDIYIYLYGACFAAAIWEKICKEGPLSVLATGTALRTLNCCSLVEPKTQLNC